MTNLKAFLVNFIIITIVGIFIGILRIFISNTSIIVSFIDGFFVSSLIHTLTFAFQWVREHGFFNIAVYTNKRFSQSIRRAGGGISHAIEYITPNILKTNKNKKQNALDEDRIEVDDFINYHEEIAWDNTKYKLYSSLTALLLSFLFSLLAM